ncbi:MAG: hypothetical protein MUC48_20630 [Leptolyngbya sp. Prado105]|nr:hypothetical protein [Leptolyngbya sp. Prado105]
MTRFSDRTSEVFTDTPGCEPSKSDFWEKGDRMIMLIGSGMALGAMLG